MPFVRCFATRCVAVVAAVSAASLLSSSVASAAFSPAQMRAAYGLGTFSFSVNGQTIAADGAGQTIAIIAGGNNTTIASELATFNAQFGLPTANLTVVNQTGGTTAPTGYASDASFEVALDVEWAHAMAPKANILVVQSSLSGTSLNSANLNTAVNTARNTAGVSVVSMSYGGGEFSGETSSDSLYTTPAGHAGVTFVASTGDNAFLSYPASSANVVAVGGTSMSYNGVTRTESVWNNSSGATGAGVSSYEPKPAYQIGVSPYARRTGPDLSLDGDPNTGGLTYFNDNGSSGMGLYSAGGTSLSAPMWAGIMAVADEGRALLGFDPLTTNQTLTMLYALYNTPYYALAFNDVTVGSSNGFSATVGYDAASGLGTPNAQFLVPYLAGFTFIPEPAAALPLLATSVLLTRRRR